jgi:large subunit ribosomal protein L5
MSRLKEKYAKEVAPALKKEFGYANVMAIPKIQKVVINMGLGEATSNAKLADVGADELGRITGQKAVVRRATKSIAQFKLRQGMPVGAMVTLRGERMYEFLDRLISVALPRVRDFRGVSPRGFDGRGNFTLGLRDQLLFPEIDYMKVDKARGMNVSVVTSARTDEEARKLLQLMGMPFRANLAGEWYEMATTAKVAKEEKALKYKIRHRNRCKLCGRPRAYMRKFALCRLCFRKLALEGDVTGVTKSSW